MMVLKKFIRLLMGFGKDLKEWSEEPESTREEEKTLIIEELPKEKVKEIHSIWDHIKPRENTQAFHLTSIIGFEWIEMQEIRRRIKEQFGAEYMNERSLYPYIKTFTDCGLFESSDVGGKRKWRKKNILIETLKQARETEKPLEAREKKPEEKKQESPTEEKQ